MRRWAWGPRAGNCAAADHRAAGRDGSRRAGAGNRARAAEGIRGEGDSGAREFLEDRRGGPGAGIGRSWTACWPTWAFRACSWTPRSADFPSASPDRWTCAWIWMRRLTAADIVNEAAEGELADLLYQLGEERDSRRIARVIVRARPIRDTRTSGNGCGRGPYFKGKAETASRDKNVSGAADCGESRVGGTRAVSRSCPCHISSEAGGGWCCQLPLAGRPPGQAAVPAVGSRRRVARC